MTLPFQDGISIFGMAFLFRDDTFMGDGVDGQKQKQRQRQKLAGMLCWFPNHRAIRRPQDGAPADLWWAGRTAKTTAGATATATATATARAKATAKAVGVLTFTFPPMTVKPVMDGAPERLGQSKRTDNGNGKSRSFDSGGRCAAFAQDDTSWGMRKRTSNDKSKSRSFDSGGKNAAFAQDDTSYGGHGGDTVGDMAEETKATSGIGKKN
jgi:hypothetical protein